MFSSPLQVWAVHACATREVAAIALLSCDDASSMKPSALALQEAVAEAYRTTPAVGSKALVERFRLDGWDVDNRAVKAAVKALSTPVASEDAPIEAPAPAESVQALPATTVDPCEPVHECANCGACGTHITAKCARCVRKRLVGVYYCNEACQTAHWPTHQKAHRAQRQLAADRALYGPPAHTTAGPVLHPALSLKMNEGTALCRAGDYRGGVKKFGKCLELPGGADSVSLHINLGLALKSSAEHAGACKAYLHAAECAPEGSPEWAEGVLRAFSQLVGGESKAACAVVAKPTWWNEPDLMVISKKVVEIAYDTSWRSAHLMRASVLSGSSGAFDRGSGPHNDPALYREAAQIFDTLADHDPPGAMATPVHRESAASMRAHALNLEAAYRMEGNMRSMLRSAGIVDDYRVLRGEYTGPGR